MFVLAGGAGAASPFSNIVDLAPHDRGPNFGNGVAMGGGTLVVSDLYVSCAADDFCRSHAHVYQDVGGIWSEVAELNLGDVIFSSFDTRDAVAVSPTGQTIAVATKDFVFIFQKPAAGWHDVNATAIIWAGLGNTYIGNLVMDDSTIVASDCSQYFDLRACYATIVFDKPAGGWKTNFSSSAQSALLYTSGSPGSIAAYTPGSVIVAGPAASDVRAYIQPVAGWHNDSTGMQFPMPAHFDFSFLDGGTLPFGLGAVFSGTDLALATTGKDTSSSSVFDPAIYVYQQSGADWSSPTQLARLSTTSNNLVPDHGFLVAGSDNLLLLATPAEKGASLPASADDLFVFQKPPGGWADAIESAKIPVQVAAVRPGFTSVAASDTALAASYYSDSSTCTTSCAKVSVFDSAPLTPSSDVTGDISLTASVTPSSVLYVLPGKPMGVEIAVQNQDDTTTSTDVTLTGDVPSGILHPAVSSPQGLCNLTGSTYSCDLGTLAPGAKASVTIMGTAPKQLTKLNQSATFTVTNDRIQRDNSLKLSYQVDTPPVAEEASFSGTDQTSGQLHGSDADGDRLAYRMVRPPKFGRASVGSNGQFSYSLNVGIATPGNDSFVYVVSDGRMDSQPATVHLNVVRDMPPLGGGGLSFLVLAVLGFALVLRRHRALLA